MRERNTARIDRGYPQAEEKPTKRLILHAGSAVDTWRVRAIVSQVRAMTEDSIGRM